jgi:phosphate transport system substrate-binding protein
MGYFGYAYFRENADRLNGVAVNSGSGCVAPTQETIEDGTYSPLSRPLFIYVSHGSAARAEVGAFLDYALEFGPQLIPATGYVPLTPEQYAEQVIALDAITQGEG